MICLFCPVESIQLLLQIILEDSASAAGLKEDTAAWVRDYIHTVACMHTSINMLLYNSLTFYLVAVAKFLLPVCFRWGHTSKKLQGSSGC